MPPLNPMNKWKIDIGDPRSRALSRSNEQSQNPPGYVHGFVATQQSENSTKGDQQHQHLIRKRAWDMALQPFKALPMNMFMMWMAGNTISIFPIMMVAMMAWRPMKALMAVNAAFKSLESEHVGSLLGHKFIFVLGNLSAIGLAVYKCHSMGLLPNYVSDWLDFVPPPERMQYLLISEFV